VTPRPIILNAGAVHDIVLGIANGSGAYDTDISFLAVDNFTAEFPVVGIRVQGTR
jgi:hypothetical protein